MCLRVCTGCLATGREIYKIYKIKVREPQLPFSQDDRDTQTSAVAVRVNGPKWRNALNKASRLHVGVNLGLIVMMGTVTMPL